MHKNKEIVSSASGLANGSCCVLRQRGVTMPSSKNKCLKVLSAYRPGADKSYTDCSIDKESMESDSDVTESNQHSRIPVCQSDEIIVHCKGNRIRKVLKRNVPARLNKNWIASIRLLTILRILNAMSIVLCAGKSIFMIIFMYIL